MRMMKSEEILVVTALILSTPLLIGASCPNTACFFSTQFSDRPADCDNEGWARQFSMNNAQYTYSVADDGELAKLANPPTDVDIKACEGCGSCDEGFYTLATQVVGCEDAGVQAREVCYDPNPGG